MKFWKKFISTLFLLSTLVSFFSIDAYAFTPNLDIASDTYIVVDKNTGQVLIEKNKDKRKAPASITKIMTLALAIPKGNMDDNITVSRNIVKYLEPNCTTIGLEFDEVVTFRDVVMGTQLISANDAANVVAEYIGGTIESFVDMMNSKVYELGLQNTHFENPNGLDMKNHYSSAADMAEITRFALTVPGFAEIFGETEYQMPPTNKKSRDYKFYAQNKMIMPNNKYYYEGIKGGKLGYTWDANHTLVAYVEKNGMELIVVTMDSKGGNTKFDDAKKLLDYCFNNFQQIELSPQDVGIKNVPVGSVKMPSAQIRLSSDTTHSFFVKAGTSLNDLEVVFNAPECYVNSRDINPTFSVLNYDGDILYTAPLIYEVEQVLRAVGEDVVPSSRLGSGDAVADTVLIVLFILIITVLIGFFIYLIYRCIIMMGYGIIKHKKLQKRRKLEKRRQKARERNEEKLLSITRDAQRVYGDIGKKPYNSNVTYNNNYYTRK